MKFLDQYRGKLLTGVNRNLPIIVDTPDAESIRQFCVGVKRLTALHRFVATVGPARQEQLLPGLARIYLDKFFHEKSLRCQILAILRYLAKFVRTQFAEIEDR